MLDLAEIIGEGAVEINPGVADTDHGVSGIAGRFDVNTFVLSAAYGAVEEIPENKSEEIFVCAQLEIPVNLVDDDCFSAHGAG
jgi:hypothetical protein